MLICFDLIRFRLLRCLLFGACLLWCARFCDPGLLVSFVVVCDIGIAFCFVIWGLLVVFLSRICFVIWDLLFCYMGLFVGFCDLGFVVLLSGIV